MNLLLVLVLVLVPSSSSSSSTTATKTYLKAKCLYSKSPHLFVFPDLGSC